MKTSRLVALMLAMLIAPFTTSHASVSPTPLVLNVTPDFPVQGGDVIGFSFSGGTPGAFLYVFFGLTPGSLHVGGVTLDIAYPFLPVHGGLVNGAGVASGGLKVPGSTPLNGLSGLTLLVQGITVKVTDGGVVWQASNTDTVSFR